MATQETFMLVALACFAFTFFLGFFAGALFRTIMEVTKEDK